jgi:thiamine kinase-like enzyme
MIELSCSKGKRVTLDENLLIRKFFDSKKNLSREVSGLKMFQMSVPENVPILYEVGEDYLVQEYAIGPAVNSDSSIGINKHTDAVVEGLSEIISVLIQQNSKRVQILNKMWYSELENLITHFRLLKSRVNLSEFQTIYSKILSDLSTIFLCYPEPSNVTYLHRDLHAGNIISCNDVLKLIDFEHSLVGPLELEFQNAIFWNDANSLDYKKIISAVIAKTGITYDFTLEKLLLSYYIADQVILANEMGDFSKVRELIHIYLTRFT